MVFRFKLETLLGYRRTLEEQAQQVLAREQGLLAEHRQRLVEMENERLRLSAEFEKRKQQKISAMLFTFYVEALGRKDQEIRSQRLAIDSQERAVEKARDELAEKVKAKKVIERAREKEHQDFVRETLRLEQNENDEQAVLRHGRG